jgi:hypothetical protein
MGSSLSHQQYTSQDDKIRSCFIGVVSSLTLRSAGPSEVLNDPDALAAAKAVYVEDGNNAMLLAAQPQLLTVIFQDWRSPARQ